MARKSAPTIQQEELYPTPASVEREGRTGPRLLELDVEEAPPFLRAQKRIPARRATLPKKTAVRLLHGVLTIAIVGVVVLVLGGLYGYGMRSSRFRIASDADIEVVGLENVSRAQIMEVMGGDVGNNIFSVPLAERRAQLEQLPWVESAAIMRFMPARLRVEVRERTPIAFARVGSRIFLADAQGTLMELPGHKKYSFPVVVGMGPSEPLSTRAARMKIYSELVGQLDSAGAHYSQDLSEIDLSDPEDVKVLANDSRGAVLVHLGGDRFLDRYKVYVAHVQEWRQQFERLDSVDLRYDRQIIVNPDAVNASRQQPSVSLASVKPGRIAGPKPALIHGPPANGPKTVALTKDAGRTNIHNKTTGPGTAKKTGPRSAADLRKKSVARRSSSRRRSRSRKSHAAAKPVSISIGAKTTEHAAKALKPSPAIAKGQEMP